VLSVRFCMVGSFLPYAMLAIIHTM
jgi:hypothetical protein